MCLQSSVQRRVEKQQPRVEGEQHEQVPGGGAGHHQVDGGGVHRGGPPLVPRHQLQHHGRVLHRQLQDCGESVQIVKNYHTFTNYCVRYVYKNQNFSISMK